MRPCSKPTLPITWSQASTQRMHEMHSYWRPLRMSMPVGHTSTHRLQLTQSPAVRSSFLRKNCRGSPRFTSKVTTSESGSVMIPWKRP
ncbi:hypothetical protein D3C87_1716340 [compost metagenome]